MSGPVHGREAADENATSQGIAVRQGRAASDGSGTIGRVGLVPSDLTGIGAFVPLWVDR